jgi:hypothetical protein
MRRFFIAQEAGGRRDLKRKARAERTWLLVAARASVVGYVSELDSPRQEGLQEICS